MEPCATIQVSVLLPVMKQMGRNVASLFYFYVSAEPLAATPGTLRFRGTPVENTGVDLYGTFLFVRRV